MRFRRILPVAILGIALTDGAAHADSLAFDSVVEPAGARYIPSDTGWNDSYTIAGTRAVEYGAAPFAESTAPDVAAPFPAVVVKPSLDVKPLQVHSVPLPPTVWSGGVLLAVSAGIVWARKRRRAGEIAMT